MTAAAVLALAAVLLLAGCGGTGRPATPGATATLVPPPTATAAPAATPVAATPVPAEALGGLSPAEVYVSRSTLVYNGLIDKESYTLFRRAADEWGDDVAAIRINSRGGDVRSAIRMGHWVYDRGLDVVVDTHCFSSCANYVFTAGRNKIIGEGAIVGWHGSAQQDEYIARSQGICLDEYWRQQFDSVVMPGLPQGTIVWWGSNRLIREERAFLERVGVRVDALVYGVMPGRYDVYRSGGYSLWTFSIEDMGKFGIGDVSYAGVGAYPDAGSLDRRGDVIVFSVGD